MMHFLWVIRCYATTSGIYDTFFSYIIGGDGHEGTEETP